tara:strand:+ start:7709 stop:8290 length:582 start_codon:yes stop_codon:yes gene_type:complete
MARELNFKLTGNSETDFVKAVNFAEKHLSHSAPKILEFAAFNYVRAARKVTKSARRNAKRKVVRLVKSRKGEQRFGVIQLSQKRPPRVRLVLDRSIRTMREVKRLEIAKVPNVGAAKGSWWGVFSDLHKPGGKKGPDVSRARRIGSLFHPAIELTNRLSYLLKIAPNVDMLAKTSAAKQLIARAEIAMEKAWK